MSSLDSLLSGSVSVHGPWKQLIQSADIARERQKHAEKELEIVKKELAIALKERDANMAEAREALASLSEESNRSLEINHLAEQARKERQQMAATLAQLESQIIALRQSCDLHTFRKSQLESMVEELSNRLMESSSSCEVLAMRNTEYAEQLHEKETTIQLQQDEIDRLKNHIETMRHALKNKDNLACSLYKDLSTLRSNASLRGHPHGNSPRPASKRMKSPDPSKKSAITQSVQREDRGLDESSRTVPNINDKENNCVSQLSKAKKKDEGIKSDMHAIINSLRLELLGAKEEIRHLRERLRQSSLASFHSAKI